MFVVFSGFSHSDSCETFQALAILCLKPCCGLIGQSLLLFRDRPVPRSIRLWVRVRLIAVLRAAALPSWPIGPLWRNLALRPTGRYNLCPPRSLGSNTSGRRVRILRPAIRS